MVHFIVSRTIIPLLVFSTPERESIHQRAVVSICEGNDVYQYVVHRRNIYLEKSRPPPRESGELSVKPPLDSTRKCFANNFHHIAPKIMILVVWKI